MHHIVLTTEQAQVVLGSPGGVEVRDEQGRTVAHLTPLSAEERALVERWKEQRDQPRSRGIPSEQVQSHLRRLAEIRRSEGLDEAKMLELLRRMQAGEQV